MKDYIKEVFGEDFFPVRRDMMNNTLGYREPSIQDAWTGASRINEPVRKAFVDTMTAIMGKNTFKYLSRAESGWQAGVSTAKHTIVIRSIIVPMSNLASNFTQLMINGVGLRDIVSGFPTMLVEIEKHLKNQQRKVEIEAALARYRVDAVMTRKLETELQSLLDSSKRMSIWPLIEAGEFSTISEGLTEADTVIHEGKWVDYM